jgi:hypothetical protein
LVIDEVSYKLIIESIRASYKISSLSQILRKIQKNPSIIQVSFPLLLEFYTIISNYRNLKLSLLKKIFLYTSSPISLKLSSPP